MDSIAYHSYFFTAICSSSGVDIILTEHGKYIQKIRSVNIIIPQTIVVILIVIIIFLFLLYRDCPLPVNVVWSYRTAHLAVAYDYCIAIYKCTQRHLLSPPTWIRLSPYYSLYTCDSL